MAAPAVTIRPATPADVPLIRSFIRELAEYERAPEQAIATEELLRLHLFGERCGASAACEGPRRGPTAECLIGEIDGVPQGFALFFTNFSTWLGRPGLYLEDLFVRPPARRHGLGRAMLARLASEAVARGCGRLEWAVLDWNEPAISFYRALGAEPMSEWTVFRLSGAALASLGSAAPEPEPAASP